MKNLSGCVDASEVGAGTGNVSRSDGLVTGPPQPHVSLVIAREIRSETVIAIAIVIVKGTVRGSGNETGIGLLGVVVGMAVRAVRVVGGAEAADTVEATATGHWPRDWDSNVFAHAHMGSSITLGQTFMN